MVIYLLSYVRCPLASPCRSSLSFLAQHSNKGPGQTFFPRKVLDELRVRLENLGSAGCSSDDEYILRCIQMRDDLDDEWRQYSEAIDKDGIIAQSM